MEISAGREACEAELIPTDQEAGGSSPSERAQVTGPSPLFSRGLCGPCGKAEPQLDDAGLYDLWMLGGPGIPHWTAFTLDPRACGHSG